MLQWKHHFWHHSWAPHVLCSLSIFFSMHVPSPVFAVCCMSWNRCLHFHRSQLLENHSNLASHAAVVEVILKYPLSSLGITQGQHCGRPKPHRTAAQQTTLEGQRPWKCEAVPVVGHAQALLDGCSSASTWATGHRLLRALRSGTRGDQPFDFELREFGASFFSTEP